MISFAVAVCAWFGLGAQQARNVDRVTNIVQSSNSLTPAQAARADSMLAGASTLNPDRMVTLLRGEVAQERGQRRRALKILVSVARAEPLNLDAWAAVANAAYGQSVLPQAVSRLAFLDPQLAHKG